MASKRSAMVYPGVTKPAPRRWGYYVGRWEVGSEREDFYSETTFDRQWKAAQAARFAAEQCETLEAVFTALQRAASTTDGGSMAGTAYTVTGTDDEAKPYGISDGSNVVGTYADPRDVADALVTFYGWTRAQVRKVDFDAILAPKPGTHYTYNMILQAAKERGQDFGGYRYAVVTLAEGDSIEDPASTKRVHYGPAVWLWQIHPSGITATQLTDVSKVPASIADGTARLPGPDAHSAICAAVTADLTGEDVTDDEGEAVHAWLREWLADCEGSEVVAGMSPAALLGYCDSAIEGGLRFVLADVRDVRKADRAAERAELARLAEDVPAGSVDFSDVDEGAREAWRAKAAERRAEYAAEVAALEARLDGSGFYVERDYNGGEDGYLWQVKRDGSVVGDGGWSDKIGALQEALDHAKLDKLTEAQRSAVWHLRSMTPDGSYAVAVLARPNEPGAEVLEVRTAEKHTSARPEVWHAAMRAQTFEDYAAPADHGPIALVDTDGDIHRPGDDTEPTQSVPSAYEVAQCVDDIYAMRSKEWSPEREQAHGAAVRELLDMLTRLSDDDQRDIGTRTLGALGFDVTSEEDALSAIFNSVNVVSITRMDGARPGSIEARASHTLEVSYRHAGLADITEPGAWIIEPGREARAVFGRDLTGAWSVWMS